MFRYYSAIIGLTCASLCILTSLVWENNRFSNKIKGQFTFTYVTIMAAALSEWAALRLNGAPLWTLWIHKIVKCCDYTFTPLLTYSIVHQIDRSKKNNIAVLCLNAVNAIVQILSIFTGWTFYVDSDNIYHHGPYYAFFIVVYILSFLVCLVSIIRYSKNFSKRNLFSLFFISLLVILSVIIQEVNGDNVRISYLAIAIGITLVYIHYSEFYQQQNDDLISWQHKEIRTDALTGMPNRYAYNELLSDHKADYPDESLVVFSIDINGLKKTNDSLGHAAGDELIIGASKCILGALSKYGTCFRTGGDEFVCILNMAGLEITNAQHELEASASKWSGTLCSELHLAIGYARSCDNPGFDIEKLIIAADNMMYGNKENFYTHHPELRR